MKIKRYPYGQTNISQIASAKGALVSPREAAFYAMAPYQAAAEAVGRIGGVAEAVRENQRRIQREEDEILMKTAAMKMKVSESMLKTDPKYRNQMQDDGTPTAKVFLDDVEESFKAVRETLNDIQDPRSRSVAMQLFDIETQGIRQEMRNHINSKREAWNAQGQIDLMNLAIEGSDFNFARKQAQELADSGVFTPAESARAFGVIDSAELDQKATGIYDQWELAEQAGNGDDYYEYVVKSDMPQQLKDQALTKIESQMANLKTIEKKKRTQLKAYFSRARTDLRVQLELGNAGPDDIENLVNKMDSFGDEDLSLQASTWRNELYLATLTGSKVDLDQQRFDALAALSFGPNGEPGWVGPSDATSRKYMSNFVSRAMTEDMSPEEQSRLEMEIVKTVGIPTDNIFQILEAGGAALSEGPLINAAQTWIELTGPSGAVLVDDGLEAGARAAVIAAANKIRAGLQPQMAAQEVIASHLYYRDQPEEVKQVINNKFQEEIDVAKQFELLKERGYMDVNGWGPGGSSDLFGEAVALGNFQQMLYDAYTAIGGSDKEAAIQSANRQFEQLYPVTYINGKREVQFSGIGGEESKQIGKTLFANDLQGKTFLAVAGGDARPVTLENQDDISFRNPTKIGDEIHYDVYYDNSPLFSEDRSQVVTVAVDKKTIDLSSKGKGGERRQELEEKIADLENKLRSAQRKVQSRTYTFDEGPDRLGNAPAEIRDIPKEINYLRAEIAKLGGVE